MKKVKSSGKNRKTVLNSPMESEAKLRIIMDSVADGITVTDLEGNILEVNEAAVKMHGYQSKEGLIGKSAFALIAEQDHSKALQNLKRTLENGQVKDTEYKFLTKDGHEFHAELSASVLRDAEGNPIGFVAGTKDITERKRLEDKVVHLASFPELNPTPVLELDQEGNVRYLNPAAERAFPDLRALGSKHPFLSDWAQVVKELESNNWAKTLTRVVEADSLFYEQVISRVAENQVRIYGRNITKRKLAEKELQKSIKLLNDTGEMAKVGGWALDLSTKEVSWTEQVGRIHAVEPGYRPTLEEALDFYAPESRPDVEAAVKRAAETGEPYVLESLFIPRGSKDRIWVRSIGKAIYSGGKIVKLAGTFQDITERKQAEEALRESEEKYRALFQRANDAIFVADVKTGYILDANKEAERLLGRSREETISMHQSQLHPSGKADYYRQYFERHVQAGQIVDFDAEIAKKDGTIVPVSISASIIRLGSRELIQGIFRDITDLKQAERELKESEEKYRTIFESANDVILLLDTEGKIVDINARLKDLGGYKREDLVGKNIRALTTMASKRSLPVMIANHMKIVSGLNMPPFQVQLVKKNGELVIMEVNAVAMRKGGEIVGDLVVMRNITERKKSEAVLRAQKELTDRILASTPNAVLVIGEDQRIVLANETFCAEFKVPKGKAEGRRIGEVLPSAAFSKTISRVLAGDGSQPDLEFRHKAAGVDKVFVAHASRMQKEVLTILRDVTPEREKQESRYLTGRLASIGEMASGIAHELNNPLTGIVGFSQLLLERDLPDDIKADMDVIYHEAKRAAAIVKNLLIFARRHPAARQPIQINKVIDEVLTLRAYEHRLHNIEVVTRLDPKLPDITVDQFLLQQAFLNLILNAGYFMTQAHKRGTLTITTERVKDNVKISFTDDGPGIPKENLDRIFDPFFTTKEVGEGTGLGLSICFGIVTSHGGKIYARSEPGKGATFVVELPIEETGTRKPEKKEGFERLCIEELPLPK